MPATGRVNSPKKKATWRPPWPKRGASGLDATPGDPESVAAGLARLRSRGFDVVVAMDGAPAAERAARILAEHGLDLPVVHRHTSGSAGVIAEGIHQGVVIPALSLAVLGEREIAGRRRAHRRVSGRRRTTGDGYQDLTPGDYVVHIDYGIGTYAGSAGSKDWSAAASPESNGTT